jgi:HTH-type transcriptional regulator, sugar sensing transcriptional regulator
VPVQTAATSPDALAREFEELGLNPSEARVTFALLQLGSAKAAGLSRAASVPRTSIYQIIEALRDKGLVVRVPGPGPALFASPGRDKVIDRLHTALQAAQEERIKQHRIRSERLREMLADTVPESPPEPVPYIELLTCDAQVREAHERLLQEAIEEVLVFNRPPYSTMPRSTHATAMAMLARGVSMRVLYQSAQVEDPEGHAFREALEAYRQAGVDGRVVDELPIKLMVVDRKLVLLSMDDVYLPDAGFPVTMLIDHPGYARVQRAAFEHFWDNARPCPPPAPPSLKDAEV